MYTQIEIESMVNSIGGILIGSFKGMKIKTDFQCPICDCIYQRTPEAVIRQKQIRCNKCRYISSSTKLTFTDEYVKSEFAKRNLILLEPYINSQTNIKVRCYCGKEFYTLPVRVLNNRKKSCGRCNYPNIGDIFGNLTIVNIITGKNNGCQVEALCKCGRKVGPYDFSRIKTGSTKSCGFCHIPKIGDIFGQLTVIEVQEAFNGGAQIICRCHCGNLWGPKPCSIILNGNTTSCGHCQLLRNGISTSNIALELHKIIEKIVGHKCEHNYKIGKKYFDIVDLQNKIAIEYDEYHWHREIRDTSKREISDTRLALRHGFKMLRIRASNDLPTETEIKKVITNHFQHGHKQYALTTPGWKQMDK